MSVACIHLLHVVNCRTAISTYQSSQCAACSVYSLHEQNCKATERAQIRWSDADGILELAGKQVKQRESYIC